MAGAAWEEARRLLAGVCPELGETHEFEMRGRGDLLWQAKIAYRTNETDPDREDIVLEASREIHPDEYSIFEYRLQHFPEDGKLRISEVNWGAVIRKPGERERGWWDGSTVKNPRSALGKEGGDFSTFSLVKYGRPRGMEELLVELRHMHTALHPEPRSDPGIEPQI